MSIQRISLIGAGAITLIVVVVMAVINFRPAKLIISLDPKSEVTSEVTATLSSEKDRIPHSLPATIKTRPGKLYVTAWGPKSEPFNQEIVLKPGEKRELIINLKLQGGAGENTEVPFDSLFPYESGDYRLRAEIGEVSGSKTKQITKIIASIHYRFADPNDPKSIEAERNLIVTEIKEWLKNRGVPNSIPLEVSNETY